ncbi:hypothetical protein [Brachyspira pulli]|uniref:hypothetical protein n=1 Tax=Brachyspira pulli TaxID=310721 RepID=UPI003003E9A5
MLKKFFKLILISIISILLISCKNDILDDMWYIQVLVTNEEYLPVTVKIYDSGGTPWTTIGSVTSSDKDDNGNYIREFEVKDLYRYGGINVYKNNDILIHE